MAPGRRPLTEGPHRELSAVIAVALAVVVVIVLSTVYLSVRVRSLDLVPGRPWWEGWVHWDSGWYRDIAQHGYSYTPGHQGPVAFFPLYPLLMRWGGSLVGSVTGPGVVITLASGVGAAVLLSRWLQDRLSPEAAWTALLLFLAYPFSFYLFGPVYADALFLLAVLGSFTALERGQPVVAGLIGAAATAARPLGAVLVVGLVARSLERTGTDPAPDATGWRRSLRRMRPGDTGVLLSAAGVASYAFFLWWRFGDPLAFVSIEKAWGQEQGPAAWFKVDFFRQMAQFRSLDALVILAVHAGLTVLALILLPRVVRRLGWGYGIYTILMVVVPALSTKNFFGMGRYLLPAFPCFAVAGELLADRRRWRSWVLTTSGATMLALASLFARAYYVA